MADQKTNIIINLKDKVSSGAKGISSSLGKVNSKLKITERSSALLGKSMRVLSTGFKALSVATSALGIASLKASADMEKQKIAFDTMLGSADKADKLLKEIAITASTTPFELTELIEGSKKLLAYNIEAEKIIPTLTSLGNIAAAVGTEKMPQLILAYGQVRAAQKLTGNELRQFTEAGVPLLGELADQFGVTAGEIQDMISKGLIGFPDVEKAIGGMSAEGGKFFNLMDRQSKTFSGTLSNIKDNFVQAMIAIGDMALPTAKKVATAFKNMTDTSNLPQFVAKIRVAMIDIQTTVKIGAETIKEVISAPFTFETYKTIFEGLLIGFQRLFDAIRKGSTGVSNYLAELRKKELDENLTLQEEIIKIREEANQKKIQIQQDLNTQLTEIEIEQREREIEALKNDLDTKSAIKDDFDTQELDKKNQEIEQEKEINAVKLYNHINYLKNILKNEKLNADKTASLKSDLLNFELQLDALRKQNAQDTLTFISTLSQSENETLRAIGKASALSMSYVNTAEAVTKALASAPPPFNFALAGLVATAGATQSAKIMGVKFHSGKESDTGVNREINATINSNEWVVTAQKQSEMINGINELGVRIAELSNRFESGGGGSTTVNLVVDGETLAQVVAPHIRSAELQEERGI